MNLIITAGGTRERIDSVRTITNEATGKLGSLIAEEFARRLFKKEHKIYYLCGVGAILPEINASDLEIICIEGTDQLLCEMKRLLTTKKIHTVVHSMAVSDYKVSSVTTIDQVAQAMYDRFHEGMDAASCEEWQSAMQEIIRDQSVKAQVERGQPQEAQVERNQQLEAQSMKQTVVNNPYQVQNKISSNLEYPLLMLEKTPKVIQMIKGVSPSTHLVGFKLLSKVSRDTLIDTAYQLLQRNACDYVLANDTDEIKDGQHVGYLVDKTGRYQTFTSKEEIAKGIADSILTF